MTRANVRVRPATSDDVEALAQLVCSTAPDIAGRLAGDDRTEALVERITTVLSRPERSVLIATDEAGAIAGFLTTRLDEIGSYDLTPVLHITHLLVAPDQRRRGVGRALLSAAVHLAEDAEVENVLTTSAAGSREGNRYFARIGFAPLVVHRIAPVSTLRRTLGMTDVAGRLAVLRRARLARVQRSGFGTRPVGRGA